MTFIKQACCNVTMYTYLELENVLEDNASGEEYQYASQPVMRLRYLMMNFMNI